MALTDTACRAAKGRETEYKLSDGGGLYLLVKPSGSRLWNQACRFSGKQKKLSHGAYPSVSLAEARRLRDEAKKLLASGVDPGANKKSAKLTAVISATNTFGGIADEYLQRIEDEGAAASTVTKNRWLHERFDGALLVEIDRGLAAKIVSDDLSDEFCAEALHDFGFHFRSPALLPDQLDPRIDAITHPPSDFDAAARRSPATRVAFTKCAARLDLPLPAELDTRTLAPL